MLIRSRLSFNLLSKIQKRFPPQYSSHALLSCQQNNFGISVIHECEDLIVLWKTSNVGIKSTDIVRRAAAPPVEEYCSKNFGNSCFIITNLSTEYSGLLLCTKTEKMKYFVLGNALNIIYSFCALVEGQCTEFLSNDLSFEIMGLYPSKTHGYITMGNIKVSGKSNLICPERLCNHFSSRGLRIIGQSELKAFISLTAVKVPVNPAAEKNIDSFTVNYSVKPPAKFLKYIKREELFHDRSARLEIDKDTAQQSRSVFFRNNLFLVPSKKSLDPRESSAILVDAVLAVILKNQIPRPLVLDVGCASGALLLSILATTHAASG